MDSNHRYPRLADLRTVAGSRAHSVMTSLRLQYLCHDTCAKAGLLNHVHPIPPALDSLQHSLQQQGQIRCFATRTMGVLASGTLNRPPTLKR